MAAKTRPVVILSRDDPDPPRSLFIYVPLTRQNRGSPYEVSLGHLPLVDDDSVANVQGIASLPLVRLVKRLGSIPAEDLDRIKRAVSYACGLSE